MIKAGITSRLFCFNHLQPKIYLLYGIFDVSFADAMTTKACERRQSCPQLGKSIRDNLLALPN
jgi:hypothetical protein